MQLDIYKRPEPGGKLSYLVVPAGQAIPAEAENIEWQSVARGQDLDATRLHVQHHIDDAEAQLREKGYAITSVTQQVTSG